MRRADRLFRIVQLLRGRRLSTAAWIAEKLEVSPRTVYRDVADLQAQGVPIDGEAGVGYRLVGGFDLPPLMFTTLEAQALVAAVRLAQSRLDRELALAAEDALGKIIGVLREAASMRRRIRFDYEDAQGAATSRTARPLGCYHWQAVWTLAAWCEHRTAFRSFRIDRMRTLDVLDEVFRDEPGRTLPDFLRQMRSEYEASLASP